jgi:hypothetical protein
MRQLALLVGGVLVLAGSATTTVPYRGTRSAQPPAQTRASAPGAERPIAPPRIAWLAVSERVTSGVGVRADIQHGRAPVAILQRGGAEVGRVSLARSGTEWSGELVAAAGDYQLTVVDGASRSETVGVMARTITCSGGERRLVASEVAPGKLIRVGAEHAIHVPRWYREDQDVAFAVEYLRDGKLAYLVSGHTDDLAQNLGTIEGAYTNAAAMCSHTFGERYVAPELPVGSCEIRVHREGATSVVAHVEVVSSEREIALPFVAMTGPAARAGAARVARVPSCPGWSLMRDLATGDESGYTVCGDRGYSRTGATVPATAAEFRAMMRDPEVAAIRARMAEMLDDKGPHARPDFEYDSSLSPDTNWHRRRAWEKRDSERQFANERTLAERARKHRPALAARVKRFGGPWTADETPAPMPGWPGP